jgi:hypothetical protein
MIDLEAALWEDERRFQEARQIVIAQYQSIIFGGYLPVVLGSSATSSLAMILSADGTNYDPTKKSIYD